MTTDTTTMVKLAGEAYDWFERREREEGESFYALKDGAPDWLHDLVREAHGSMLPDDWRYDCIHSALGHIRDEDSHDFADGQVDTYTGARLAWLASGLERVGYVDEACETYDASASLGVVERIALGQYAEASEVFESVLESLRERAEDDEDDA